MIDIDKIYKQKYGTPSYNPTTLGWGSKDSQIQRFRILLDISKNLKNDSFLDVGCGYGDLCQYVNSKKYMGIDIRHDAIQIAKETFPEVSFKCCGIKDINETYDWVISSGIFCFNHANWSEETNKIVNLMYNRCEKGIAFNLLYNTKLGNQDKDMKYVELSDISLILRDYSNYVIRNDYRPNDITIYIYK